MVVMAMENVSESLRGELTRYMLEVKAGVFVGNLNSRVTGLLWEKVCRQTDSNGGAVLIQNTNNEQGYSITMNGDRRYVTEDFDGLTLLKRISNQQNS